MGKNLKGMYFEKDLGDGTRMKIIRLRRPDDANWALAIQLSAGTKKATCFLEDSEGKCFAGELADGLVDYLEDVAEIAIEEGEAKGDSFITAKRKRAKKDKDADDFKDAELSTETETVKQ
jgi:hypothetical protein